MLAYILSIAIALASIILFFSAFFAPKLHRKDDFLWSGVGLFYGLVLWLCAVRVTGGVLLGQMAAVLLLLSFGWQTISLRAAIANPEKQAGIKTFSVVDWIGGGLGKKKAKLPLPEKSPVSTQTTVKPEPVTETPENAIAESLPTLTDETISLEVTDLPVVTEVISFQNDDPENELVEEILVIEEKVVEPLPEKIEELSIPSVVTRSQPFAKPKKPSFWRKFFGKKSAPTQPENITAALDAIESVDSIGESAEKIDESLENEPSLSIETKALESSEIPAQNEIEENWEDDWVEAEELEHPPEIDDESAPTIIEAIASNNVSTDAALEQAFEEENPKFSETENDPDSLEKLSYKFAPYIEVTEEVIVLEEIPLFEEGLVETELPSETMRSPMDIPDSEDA